jgi:hypothetical protein
MAWSVSDVQPLTARRPTCAARRGLRAAMDFGAALAAAEASACVATPPRWPASGWKAACHALDGAAPVIDAGPNAGLK